MDFVTEVLLPQLFLRIYHAIFERPRLLNLSLYFQKLYMIHERDESIAILTLREKAFSPQKVQ